MRAISTIISESIFLARLLREQEVPGSNPGAPIGLTFQHHSIKDNQAFDADSHLGLTISAIFRHEPINGLVKICDLRVIERGEYIGHFLSWQGCPRGALAAAEQGRERRERRRRVPGLTTPGPSFFSGGEMPLLRVLGNWAILFTAAVWVPGMVALNAIRNKSDRARFVDQFLRGKSWVFDT